MIARMKLILALLAGLSVLVAACGETEESTSTAGAVVRVGQRAPDFTLTNAQGGTVSLADFQDHRPVLLYFSMGPG